MASSKLLRSMRHLASILLLLSSTIVALQVSPNSPCAAACLDSADLDRSDPNSSNTKNSDISCEDADYTNESRGRKFKECMSCLQDSSFSRGAEGDLSWFLYNLRYTFGFCIFGYPNATGIGSNPCMTSEACGPLEGAFTQGTKNPSKDDDQFAYCTSDGKTIFEDKYPSCLACVSSDNNRRYLSNFLVALEAGCEQHPSNNNTVALNDTIFTDTPLSIVNLTTSLQESAQHNDGYHLPIAAIIAIVIGSFIIVALAIGCVFLQLRKRLNRREREERARHFRSSSLEFRCATHVNPFSPGFRNSNDGWTEAQQYHPYQQDPHHQQQQQQHDVVVDEKEYAEAADALHSHPPEGPVRNFSRKEKQPASITTTMELAQPAPAVTSPRRDSPSDYGSPASATSAMSSVPFLASFNNKATVSPSSPLVQQSSWEEMRRNGAARGLTRSKARTTETCAPVAARQIQTSFPPPPKR